MGGVSQKTGSGQVSFATVAALAEGRVAAMQARGSTPYVVRYRAVAWRAMLSRFAADDVRSRGGRSGSTPYVVRYRAAL
jgi:hypothetical protein